MYLTANYGTALIMLYCTVPEYGVQSVRTVLYSTVPTMRLKNSPKDRDGFHKIATTHQPGLMA
jgi:hypothetical protein